MRSAPPKFSFSAGETSPLLDGRPDYQRHQQGAAKCCGFIPLRQGGATRAPGTFYLGETASSDEARLIPFEFAENDAAVLEFTVNGMRVWRYGALVMNGGAPYVLAHGMTLAEIEAMQWSQSADVIYIATGTRPIRSLKRFALDNWEIVDTEFFNGPFMSENLDDDIVITASDDRNNITLTSTEDVFVDGHVGGLFFLREVDSNTPTWVGNTDYNEDDQVVHGGNVYACRSTGTTDAGPNPPLHTSGVVLSGVGKVRWRYQSSTFGVVRITARTDARNVSATVLRRLPPGLVSDGTARWAEGAWSAKNGYPAAISEHDQRLYAAATPTSPRTFWASALGGFLDMEPTALPDSAFAYAIGGSMGRNAIRWLADTDKGLVAGALGEEIAILPAVTGEALSIDNIQVKPQSTIGSAKTRPISPRGAPIFISRDRRRLFEMRYDLTQEKRRPIELSLPSDHLGADQFRNIVWQSSPIQIAWITRDSGDLAIMVSETEEDVLGWAPLPVANGEVISVCVTPSADGSSDVVTAAVRRTINSTSKVYVEQFEDIYTMLFGNISLSEINHLYSAVRFTSEVDVDVIDGFAHLDGERVQVWTPEGNAGEFEVAGGGVKIGFEVREAIVGLFDNSHVLRTHDVAPFISEGSSDGRQKSIKAFAARVHRTSSLSARSLMFEGGEQLADPPPIDLARRKIGKIGVGDKNGVLRCEGPSGHASEVAVEFRPLGGAPATLLSLTPVADVTDG